MPVTEDKRGRILLVTDSNERRTMRGRLAFCAIAILVLFIVVMVLPTRSKAQSSKNNFE